MLLCISPRTEHPCLPRSCHASDKSESSSPTSSDVASSLPNTYHLFGFNKIRSNRSRHGSLSSSAFKSTPMSIPCHRCGAAPSPLACSLPSLSKVSSHNRSLHGTNPHSRGDSSLELEAIAAVHELSFAVLSISVSEMLPRTSELIFVNVNTIEGQPYCLELTMKGWRVTSIRHDCMQGDFTRLELFTTYFDTLYDLMDDISPGYRSRFSEKLAQKLRMLQAGEDMNLVAPTSSYACTPQQSDNPLQFYAHSMSPFSMATPFAAQGNS